MNYKLISNIILGIGAFLLSLGIFEYFDYTSLPESIREPQTLASAYAYLDQASKTIFAGLLLGAVAQSKQK